jgi:hypothetical protein
VNVATNDQKNQVIRADDVARAMVDVAVLGTGKRRGPIFENRDIQAIVESPPPESSGDLGLSEVTVKIHRGSAMRKMGARSLADLVRMADTLKNRIR